MPEQPEAEGQGPYVLGLLRDQANRLTEQAARTTHDAGEARASAERLDGEAEEWRQRAGRLNRQADSLRDQLISDP